MNARSARGGRLFIMTVAIALLMALGAAAPAALADEGIVAVEDVRPVALQAQGGKVYKSKRAAKKAVIAKVRSRWQKLSPKVKVEDAAKKKNMTAAQKKAYKKSRKQLGKNAKKYRFYLVTFKAPRFTVRAKYRNAKGKILKYSLTASAHSGCDSICSGPVYDDKTIFYLEDGWVSPGKSWYIIAVKKGSGTQYFGCSVTEEHVKLTGTGGGNYPLSSGGGDFELKD